MVIKKKIDYERILVWLIYLSIVSTCIVLKIMEINNVKWII